MVKHEDQLVPLPKNILKKSDAEILGQHTKELEWQGKILNWTFGFMVAILVVCFIAFITFLIDAWRFHQESYKEFNNILQQINTKMVNPTITSILKKP